MADLFEQYVGNELIYQSQHYSPHIKVRYWRDAAGPEIDYVLEISGQYIPIEVKWTERPRRDDARHVIPFLAEQGAKLAPHGYVICRCPRPERLDDRVLALPWHCL